MYAIKASLSFFSSILPFKISFPASSPRSATYSATVDNVQLEEGSLASDYAPHFEPFTFPPVTIDTQEGNNTLFATEGASALIYRKQT